MEGRQVCLTARQSNSCIKMRTAHDPNARLDTSNEQNTSAVSASELSLSAIIFDTSGKQSKVTSNGRQQEATDSLIEFKLRPSCERAEPSRTERLELARGPKLAVCVSGSMKLARFLFERCRPLARPKLQVETNPDRVRHCFVCAMSGWAERERKTIG